MVSGFNHIDLGVIVSKDWESGSPIILSNNIYNKLIEFSKSNDKPIYANISLKETSSEEYAKFSMIMNKTTRGEQIGYVSVTSVTLRYIAVIVLAENTAILSFASV